MQSKAIIRELLEKNSAMNMARLARAVGLGRQNIWNTLYDDVSRTLTTDKFVKLANALGYDVMVVPKGSKVKDGIKVTVEGER